jgi:hypothetical protein
MTISIFVNTFAGQGFNQLVQNIPRRSEQGCPTAEGFLVRNSKTEERLAPNVGHRAEAESTQGNHR